MPPRTTKLPPSKRSGVVRHTDTVVSLEHALERVPQTERVDVVLEHDQTGVASRVSWNRLAVCVALRKGSERYGIFETVGQGRREGFSLVTRHPTLAHMFVFVYTGDPADLIAKAGGVR